MTGGEAAEAPSLEIVFAEFGEERRNAGGGDLPVDARLEPSLGSVRAHFPEARVTLYTDADPLKQTPGVEVVDCSGHWHEAEHPRKSWRLADYYKVLGLTRSRSEVAISLDSDMMIVDARARVLLDLTLRFGMCIPANPRHLVKIDGRSPDYDGDYETGEDPSEGLGQAYNMSPIALRTDSEPHRRLLAAYLEEMEARPARGPLAMWRAVWRTGVVPYVLPPQWCVCNADIRPYSDRDLVEPLVLHAGHQPVVDRYVPGDGARPRSRRSPWWRRGARAER